ncbi:sigma 54-interacting transcriptional regulator, partial [Candidatus Woesearchaeota archaeon]|nr:sigma 54-interacting transcriptional regulator [Candidatus Woesearchaeota archaeon]
QEREIRPVGSSKTRKVDVRVLAATARDLQKEVGRKTFREDLYYRLNVMAIHLPPLRERTDDLAPLIDHFIRKFNQNFDLQVRGVSAASMKRILAHHWPGNVRELENVIQRGMVLAENRLIEASHLPEGLGDKKGLTTRLVSPKEDLSLKTLQKQLEAKYIAAALKRTKGNKSKAAQALEISYPSLLKKIKEYGLE